MNDTEQAGGNGPEASGRRANIDRDIFELMKSEMGVATLILLGGDLDARNRQGWRDYGSTLHAFDGRNTWLDAYEEALDLAVYLRKGMIEQPAQVEWLGVLYGRALQMAAQLKARMPA